MDARELEEVTAESVRVDLLGLPTRARLCLGSAVVVEVTGLRNPCPHLDGFRPGLMKAVLGRDEQGSVVRKAGVMGIVLAGGEVSAGDLIQIILPPEPHEPLTCV